MTLGGEQDRQTTSHPWLVAVLTALVTSLLVALVLRPDGQNVSYASGANMGTLIIPVVVAGFALSRSAWPWVASAAVTALAFSVVLVGLTMIRTAGEIATADGPAGDRSAGVAEDPGTGESEEAVVDASPVAPGRIGAWRKRSDAPSRRLVAQARSRYADAPAGTLDGDPVLGVYGRGQGRVFLVAFAPGAGFEEEVSNDAEQGAIEFLAGATGDRSPESVDPGPLGGGAACTDDVDAPGDLVVCAWTAAGVSGQLTFFVPGLTVEDAVPLVHQFREAATSQAG